MQQLGVGGGGGVNKYKYLSYYFQNARFLNSHCYIFLVLNSLQTKLFFLSFFYNFYAFFLIKRIFDLWQWGFQNTLEISVLHLSHSKLINELLCVVFEIIFLGCIFFTTS